MKNLVIFHMESVSNIIYKLNEECFPNLRKWSQYFESYSNYYSTATSTLMVMADLFFGDISVFDESGYLEDIYTVECNKKSLFEYLNEYGYFTKVLFLGYSGHERNRKLNTVINKNGTFWDGDNVADFLFAMDECNKEEPAFAVFIEDNASHITYCGKRVRQGICGVERYMEKYKVIDKTIGTVFEWLENNELLNNTVVLLYGDHGDEYWFHGYHEGYTHAIEPYTSLVHCPLFIFNGENILGIDKQVVSTTDIYSLVINALGMDKKIVGNGYAISRNLFARQVRRADVFNKGYSITDGEYTLLLTQKGLSLFENKLDPYNMNNILDFFDLCGDSLKYNPKFDKMISSHYKNFMTDLEKEEIKKRFEKLRKELRRYIEGNKCLEGRWNLNKLYRGSRVLDFMYCRKIRCWKMIVGRKMNKMKFKKR